jgi:hypothetical protein
VFALSATASLLASSFGWGPLLAFDIKATFAGGQLWRLLSSRLAFTSPPEIVFGLILVYMFRVFERQSGSRKFAGTLLCLAGLTLLFEALLMLSLGRVGGFMASASGPYWLVFGLFAFFFIDIPQVMRFRLIMLPLSDKVFVYALGLQLALARGKTSLLTGLCGLVAGALYRSNLVPALRRVRFPRALADCCERHLAPIFSSRDRRGYGRVDDAHEGPDMPDMAESPRVDAPRAGARAGAAAGAGPGFGVPMVPLPAARPPSDESVATVVSLGFSPDEARQALVAAGGNVDLAVERLLERARH